MTLTAGRSSAKVTLQNEQCESGPIEQEIQIEAPDDWPSYKLKGDKSYYYFLKLEKT